MTKKDKPYILTGVYREEKSIAIQKAAFEEFFEFIGRDRAILAKALGLKRTTVNNFVRLGRMPSKVMNCYGVAGYDAFTKLIDDSPVTREQLAHGIPCEIFSDYTIHDCVAFREQIENSNKQIPVELKEAVKNETDRLFHVFGSNGLARVMQVPITTVRNWANDGAISARVAESIAGTPQIRAILAKYGFSISTLRPDLEN